MQVGVIASFTALPGKGPALLQALRDNVAFVREREPGCLRCDIFVATDDADRISLVEIYESQAAYDLHRSAPYGGELLARVQPHMDGWPSAGLFSVDG
ncbi:MULTISPECIES: putative quinol monooxygenase [unclassified Sphingomonas]|uniref:putative quinol monooxygenase n=1 Tax=unclassified Sphingomonas TaxID=196159 RepID=UPI00092B2A8A|nr:MULTISPECIES: putative quinol monooxygenase [unclassified Sphingomonas]MBN8848887.1 antibiotic biosynthesis monooxygenase [Sphingomonas sp.]MBS0284207.1 antibiotic biosynthesis monooxygenase [Pseudomonadota bacterium]OJV32357.1 MAG: hypothetical protein BGO24_16455 [Sphingomonas sp. 67-36]